MTPPTTLPPAGPGQAPGSRYLLALLFVGVLMGALDLAILGPALPAIKAQFTMSDRQLAVLFNAYVLCQMIGTPVIAKFADRAGPRVAYCVSIGFFAAGSLLLVVASEPATLYFGRALQGFGGGGIFPVAAAVVGSSMPARERGPALGVLGTVFGLAFIVGPVLGGLLLPYGWHWLFAINLPISVVLLAGAVRLLPAGRSTSRKPLDLAGITALSVMLTVLVYGMSRLDSLAAGLLEWPTLCALLGAVALLPVFWEIEKRAVDPIVRPGLLGSRPVLVAALIGAGIGAIQAGGAFYPAYAIASLGVSDSLAAWLLVPGVVVATIASPVAGRLIGAVGTRATIAVGLGLIALSLLIFGAAAMSVPAFVAASMIGNAGLGGVLGAPLRMVVLDNSAPAERGSAQGLLSNFTSVGRLLGAAIVGGVAAAAGSGAVGYQSAFLLLAGVAALLAAVAAVLLPVVAIPVEVRNARKPAADGSSVLPEVLPVREAKLEAGAVGRD
jgi:MFS family permease